MVDLWEVRRVTDSGHDPDRLEGDIIIHRTNMRLYEGRRLQNGELLSILAPLMVTENKTTTPKLGFTLVLLGTNSASSSRLKQNQSSVSKFIVEVPRLHSPIPGAFRKPVGTQRFGVVEFEVGELVDARFAASNSDLKVWGDADYQPLIDRRPSRPHFLFGASIYFCIGAALSRFELTRSISSILDRYMAVELTENPKTLPSRRACFNHLGMTSLQTVLLR